MQQHPHLIPCLIAAGFLFWAGDRHPYGYYQILRFFTTGTAVFCAYSFWNHKIKVIPWLLISIAILFNPLAPIHLEKQTWRLIDIAVGVVFLVLSGISTKRGS